MTMLDKALDEIPEEHIVDAGNYELVITSVKEALSKAKNPQIVVAFELQSDANAKPIFDYLPFPTEDMDERTVNSLLRKFKSLFVAFGIEATTIYEGKELLLSDGKGRSGWAKLFVQESDEYGDSNRVSRYLANI